MPVEALTEALPYLAQFLDLFANHCCGRRERKFDGLFFVRWSLRRAIISTQAGSSVCSLLTEGLIRLSELKSVMHAWRKILQQVFDLSSCTVAMISYTFESNILKLTRLSEKSVIIALFIQLLPPGELAALT